MKYMQRNENARVSRNPTKTYGSKWTKEFEDSPMNTTELWQSRKYAAGEILTTAAAQLRPVA
jgi:hypothetical protein